MEHFSRYRALVAALAACAALAGAQTKKIKAVILTGQHSYPKEAFFGVFDAMTDLEYTHVDLPGHSEIFENVDNWPYDVIVMHNSGQNISEKRQQNFLKLLNRGVGLVVIHHGVCAYEGWNEFRKIEGTKFYGAAEEYEGKRYESNYIEPTQVKVIIDDRTHPLMKGYQDFEITDEVYTDMSYEKDNHVLAHTTHPSMDGAPQVWTRRYAGANVFVITLGHRAGTLAGPFMKTLIPNALRWTITAAPSGTLAPAPRGRSTIGLPGGRTEALKLLFTRRNESVFHAANGAVLSVTAARR